MNNISKRAQIDQLSHELTKELVARGKLVEAGFALFAHYVISKSASQVQLDDMRIAFMAGAEHIFSSMLNVLDEGEEPTAADLKRMDMIHAELEIWRARLSELVHPAKGSA